MSLNFLYHTAPGRMVLKLLVRPGLSKLCGKFLDTGLSKFLIKPFIRNNSIDMSEYLEEDYSCFNDCFCRRIKPEARPVDTNPASLICPCDGLLSVYKIQSDLVIPVKQSRYSISDLLQNKELASEFDGGTCLVYRLCVNHYHRYAYPDSGSKGKNIFIPGKLHTVRPIALREVPVFTENSREYTVLNTDNFGQVVQMEVGAMLVGKISNNHQEASFVRGDEKGCFLYGGSTIIMLLKKDSALINEDLFLATEREEETPVKLGQVIGTAI